PQCAAAWVRVRELPLRLCVRHFPLAAKRPRSPRLESAAEAAVLQREDAFWALVDSIYADHGHQDDPHLWERARALWLDLDRFERDRRSPEIAARVRADVESVIRGGVGATPTACASGERLDGDVGSQLAELTAR